jgi:hypothetical protein
MNNTNRKTIRLVHVVASLCLTLILNGCFTTQDPVPGKNTGTGTGTGTGSNSGSGSSSGSGSNSGSGSTTGVITYTNHTFTPITLTINSQVQTVAVGSSATVSGTPGTTYSGTAVTSGSTSGGTQVGLKLTWNLNGTFPSNSSSVSLDVISDYFFVFITNNHASKTITQVYVNYGLTSQTLDNISIPNNGTKYGIGYYKAYTNSNVRLESPNSYWYWSTLGLHGTSNQSVSLAAI